MTDLPSEYAEIEKVRAGIAPAFKVIQGGRGEALVFRREKFADIEPHGMEWLIKHFLPSHGVGIIAGPPGVGKSFVVLYFCLRLVLGKHVLNHRSRAAGVLYVAAEGQNGMRKRIKALREKFDVRTEAFHFIGQAPDLRDPASMAALTAAAEEADAEMRADAGIGLGLIVIDTTAASMPGGNENAGEDMSRALDNARVMSEATGAFVLLVGHTGKDEDKGVRGWSGQIGNSDAIIYLTKDKEDDRLRLGNVFKLKDGECGERFAYRLKSIHMGVDEDGDAITSAYPAFEEIDDEGAAKRKAVVLSPGQQLVMRALRILLDTGPNQPAPALPGVQTNTRAVAKTDLRDRAVQMGFADADEKSDTVRKAFARDLTKLAALNQVRVEGALVWVLR